MAHSIKSELSLGYAFDRSTFEGPSFRNQDQGSANLGNSWVAAWNLKLEL